MFRHRFRLGVLGALLSLALSYPAAAEPRSPSAVVAAFQSVLIDVMKEARGLSVKDRFDRLAPRVEEAFHLPLMIQIASGGSWKAATQSERLDLVRAFRRMSVSTLATLFDSYDGEVFNVVEEKPGQQNTRYVFTHLVKSDKSKVEIIYVARQFDDRWRLIDVIVDRGISELKVRQSEYHAVLRSEGVPGLIALLNGKADELIAK